MNVLQIICYLDPEKNQFDLIGLSRFPIRVILETFEPILVNEENNVTLMVETYASLDQIEII